MSNLEVELRRRFGMGLQALLLAHPIFQHAIHEATDFYQSLGIRVPVQRFVDRIERTVDRNASQSVPDVYFCDEKGFVDR